MALVVDVPVPGFTEVGDDGVELPPSPPPPQLAAAAQTATSAATLSGLRILDPPVCFTNDAALGARHHVEGARRIPTAGAEKRLVGADGRLLAA